MSPRDSKKLVNELIVSDLECACLPPLSATINHEKSDRKWLIKKEMLWAAISWVTMGRRQPLTASRNRFLIPAPWTKATTIDRIETKLPGNSFSFLFFSLLRGRSLKLIISYIFRIQTRLVIILRPLMTMAIEIQPINTN
jgi:hypothetical protein